MSVTIHKCPDCGHQSGDHQDAEYGCCLGWCPCKHTAREVKASTKPVTIPTFPSSWTGS